MLDIIKNFLVTYLVQIISDFSLDGAEKNLFNNWWVIGLIQCINLHCLFIKYKTEFK